MHPALRPGDGVVSDLRASRLADLWTRHQAGEPLAADERAQLVDALVTDEVFCRRILHDRRVDGALRAMGDLSRREAELLAAMDRLVVAATRSDRFVERMRARLAVEPRPRRAQARWAAAVGMVLATGAAGLLGFGLRRPRVPPPADLRAAPVVASTSRDFTPPSRVAAGPPPIRRAVLLVGSDDPAAPSSQHRPAAGDEHLRIRLEQLGFAVQVLPGDDPDSPVLEALTPAQVVVLSPSVVTTGLTPELATLPVPLVAMESSAFSRLGLTGKAWRRDLGVVPQPTREVVITDPSHPLAAGLTGQTTVLGRRQWLRWGLPGPGAIDVVGYPGDPSPGSAVFAYERGTQMPGGPAAARRVALFLGNLRVVSALNAQGWRLFDAAVSWSAAGAP
jgi:hypothetical protein